MFKTSRVPTALKALKEAIMDIEAQTQGPPLVDFC